ncbi:unnamed protein product [Urochloa humidicola]
MPPRRRARLSSRPYFSVAAAEQYPKGWLATRRSRPSKRARRAVTSIAQGGDDDGTPLSDEILVGIFADLPAFSDLVRCAATCRRWCRLVSSEADFLCRAARRRRSTPPPPLIRSLALGFFHSPRPGAAPRFAATASASRRLGGLRQPSLNALVEGLDDGLFDASRLVASRNGLLVVELRRRKRERAVKLCVCNPMTGEVTILPPLGGKQITSPFACTILTADDDERHVSSPPSSYRLLLVYGRRGFTACRTYASDRGCGGWGPEAKVWDAIGLRAKAMASMAAGTGLGAETTWLRLRWMCEKSGVVFFTAGCGGDQSSGDVYAMSLDKQEVDKVASHQGGDGGVVPSWGELHGYEMDQTSYLRSLARSSWGQLDIQVSGLEF